MSSGSRADYQWMEALLDALFVGYGLDEAMTLLRSPGERERAMQRLSAELEAGGMPAGMLASPEGQNLFVAVLSLRIKFPEPEAREKVALNIAMRERRD
ncbi:MAG: hypothetical protein WEC79_03020 [Thermomicrobiales bacterium]